MCCNLVENNNKNSLKKRLEDFSINCCESNLSPFVSFRIPCRKSKVSPPYGKIRKIIDLAFNG